MKPGFGNIQNTFSVNRNHGGTSWNPLIPLGGESPSFWYKEGTRSGLNLPNAMSPGTGDKTLVLQRKSCDTNGYAVVADNGAMDVVNNLGANPAGNGDSGFTLCGWIKSESASKTYNKYFIGKPVEGSVSGRYAIYASSTNGYLTAYVQSSGGFVSVASTIDVTGVGWTFVLMDVNYTTKKLRFFINNTQIGVDTAFTGTIAQLANAYNFYVSAGNAVTTGAAAFKTPCSYRDICLYNMILTPTQQTTLYSNGYVDGAINNYLFDQYIDSKILDVGSGGKHLTATNIIDAYDSYGTHRLLDIGYTRWINFPNKDIHVAFSGVNTACTYNPTGYTKDIDIPGSLTDFNGANSYIAITGVDRSNTTSSSYLARHITLQHYYLSTQVTWLHSCELNNKDISNYFTDDYRGLLFTKSDGSKITDIIRYATNKTGTDYDKIIKWTTESVLKFDVVTAPHICAVSSDGTKVLKFDDVHTFSLSLDSGATYPITLLTTLSLCDYGFIFDNGNIMFCNSTKVYYSVDNLATYHESTVLGIDGNAFVAGTLQNFRPWGSVMKKEVTSNGVKLLTWGAYATSGTAEYNNINQWETTDGGVNVKSVYLFGTSSPSAVCRHIHGVMFDSVSDIFFLYTGDDMGDTVQRNNLLTATRTAQGAWTHTLIGKGLNGSPYEMNGLAFKGLYYYLDGETTTNNGLKRSLKSDFANIATNQVKIFNGDPAKWTVNMDIVGGYMIICEGYSSNYITFSSDELRFFTRSFPQLTVNTSFGHYSCIGKLATGYYIFVCNEAGESVDTFTAGSTLLIKPSVIS